MRENGDMVNVECYVYNKNIDIDIMNGKYEIWCKNGRKHYECEYKNGKKDGKFIMWYDNGQKFEEGKYKDEKLDGKYVGWHANGEKRHECNYMKGYTEIVELY
jgi:antitoxin component YwqK of YwqJK toxin-antitoxin module